MRLRARALVLVLPHWQLSWWSVSDGDASREAGLMRCSLATSAGGAQRMVQLCRALRGKA